MSETKSNPVGGSFRIRRINDESVRPIKPIREPDNRPVLGADLFAECNASIFICASRGSGKTSVVGKIMKQCADRETKIVVFCANLDKDKSWIALQKYFEDHGHDFMGYTSITDPETGENMLELLNAEIQQLAKEERERLASEDAAPKEDSKSAMRTLMEKMFGSPEEEQEKKRGSGKPRKFRAPEYLIVFDDLSDEIRNSREVAKLLKNGRHFAKVIISSQYLKDLRPEARTNIDYFVLFKGLDKKTLEEIHRNAKMSVNFETFQSLYRDATRDKYSFLYVDSRTRVNQRAYSENIGVALWEHSLRRGGKNPRLLPISHTDR